MQVGKWKSGEAGRFLLDSGAKTELSDENGMGPLHFGIAVRREWEARRDGGRETEDEMVRRSCQQRAKKGNRERTAGGDE